MKALFRFLCMFFFSARARLASLDFFTDSKEWPGMGEKQTAFFFRGSQRGEDCGFFCTPPKKMCVSDVPPDFPGNRAAWKRLQLLQSARRIRNGRGQEFKISSTGNN